MFIGIDSKNYNVSETQREYKVIMSQFMEFYSSLYANIYIEQMDKILN